MLVLAGDDFAGDDSGGGGGALALCPTGVRELLADVETELLYEKVVVRGCGLCDVEEIAAGGLAVLAWGDIVGGWMSPRPRPGCRRIARNE